MNYKISKSLKFLRWKKFQQLFFKRLEFPIIQHHRIRLRIAILKRRFQFREHAYFLGSIHGQQPLIQFLTRNKIIDPTHHHRQNLHPRHRIFALRAQLPIHQQTAQRQNRNKEFQNIIHFLIQPIIEIVLLRGIVQQLILLERITLVAW